MPHQPRLRDWLGPRAGLLVAVFVYLALLRTRGISDTFWLLGDQIRDWRFAIGPWSELPLTGTPSTVGGASLGPIYYWVLWAIRHLVGPWTGNLPHAGGIGLSLVQSAADVFFLSAIWTKTQSGWIAFAVALFVATGSYDMALTATMWNPPLAVAFVKCAIGLTLIAGARESIWWTVAATAAAWLAVQSHSTALFVAAPIVASFAIRELMARRWQSAFNRLRASVEVILLLQIPFLLNMVRYPEVAVAPGRVILTVSDTLGNPATFRFGGALDSIASALNYILMAPRTLPLFSVVLVVCAAVAAFRCRRDVALASVTVMPLLLAIAGFSMWQLPYDNYWFLTLAPSAALTLAMALTAWRPAARTVGVLLALAVVVLQPSRYTYAMSLHRFPQYGALARGSREIRRRVDDVQGITTMFELPPTTEPEFLYTVLGGRISPDARYHAVIGPQGDVRFDLVKP